MHVLSASQAEQVQGGGLVLDSIGHGGGFGSMGGIILTNTMRGAASGGALGAALGAAFGVGYAVGTKIYESLSE